MDRRKRHLFLGMLGILLATGLLLVPVRPALAGADVFFGLTIGFPFATYPFYAPVYAPPSVIYGYPPASPVVVVAPPHHHVYGPPYGKAHGYWKKHSRRLHRW
jgi:hypothetical protein